jgi:hypothetical protein
MAPPSSTSLSDKEYADYLFKFMNEHATQARQHEALRERSTSFILAISAAVIGFLATMIRNSSGASFTTPLGLFLVLLGTFGIILSYKHYERNRLHTEILRGFRRELDRVLTAAGHGSIDEIARRQRRAHEDKFPRMTKIRVFWLWACVNAFIAALGVYFVLANSMASLSR